MIDKALNGIKASKTGSKKPKKKPRKHVRVRELTPVECLKTKIWVTEIEKIAEKCVNQKINDGEKKEIEITDIPKFFDMEVEDGAQFSSAKLPKFKAGLSVPGTETLVRIEGLRDPTNPNIQPFIGTKALIELGPDGFPLWKILEEDIDVCQQVIDEEVTRITGKEPDEGSSFEQQVKTIFNNRLPSSLNGNALWKMISEERTYELHHDFNVIALTAIDGDDIPGHSHHLATSPNTWARVDTIITVSAGQIVVNIALYVLSRKKGELVPQCYYMLFGVLQTAIHEQVSYGKLIAEFLSQDEWLYKGLLET